MQTKSFRLAIYSKGNIHSDKLALVLPGKLDTKDYPHIHSHVDFLAKKGFFAVSFDPPGTWDSPGDIGLYSLTNYIKATNELIDYFGSKPTFVMGHSFGGSIAMYVGITNPAVTHFASLMSWYSYKPEHHGGYPDKIWKSQGFRVSKRDMPENFDKKRELKVPYTFLEDRIRYDIREGLAKCSKPKLFILGKRDEVVNPSVVRTTYKLSCVPKELYELPFGHNYRSSKPMIKKVNAAIGDFLDKYRVDD